MGQYGILKVTVVDHKLDRRWVVVPRVWEAGKDSPPPTPAKWDTYEEAETMADKLKDTAQEEGILGVSYRAREFGELPHEWKL